MANWPNYYIKVKGNVNTNKKIEEILREQTIWSCLKIFTGYNFENSSIQSTNDNYTLTLIADFENDTYSLNIREN